jgi:hypothetical protein
MKRTTGLLLSASLAITICAVRVQAQIRLQPTSQPGVTAENEPWYQMREPVIFAGEYYYPAGSAIHFLPNEMVPSGLYRGVPLYSRTTIEPYSVVFVPIAGGLMQPYERRRTGDLVGTTGSSAPALPVDMDSPSTYSRTIQAAGPPVVASTPVQEPPEGAYASDVLTRSRENTAQPETLHANRSTAMVGRVSPSRSTKARDTSKGIFVEFQNERWYSTARPQALDPASLKQIGEWLGFPVYARDSNGSTIYIPVTKGADAYAAYSKRK